MAETTYGGWLQGSDVARPSVRRIARIGELLRAKSYLEVGVNQGKTFNRLNFEYKTAVDPRFKFDTKDFLKEGVTFYEDTSDAFFSAKLTSELFDVIFLDGMHTFHQTFKDFVNSIACSHERTVWLIDDVIPLDIYGSLPDQKQGVNLRRSETNSTSGNWTGDVYKLMFAVHDFFPTLSYVVTVGGHSGQMLLWKEGRVGHEPILDSLEAIDRLSYPDFLRLKSKLNHGSEDEAIAMLSASFRARYPSEYQHDFEECGTSSLAARHRTPS